MWVLMRSPPPYSRPIIACVSASGLSEHWSSQCMTESHGISSHCNRVYVGCSRCVAQAVEFEMQLRIGCAQKHVLSGCRKALHIHELRLRHFKHVVHLLQE